MALQLLSTFGLAARSGNAAAGMQPNVIFYISVIILALQLLRVIQLQEVHLNVIIYSWRSPLALQLFRDKQPMGLQHNVII